MTHPEIRKRLRSEAQEMARRGTQVSILDAPVLLKAGWADLCDALVFIDCPEDQRRARAVQRGWTAEEFARREASQEPIEEKRRRADFVLENSGDLGYIQTQVERCWHSLIGPAD
jgi:dephospho-CoA kinase